VEHSPDSNCELQARRLILRLNLPTFQRRQLMPKTMAALAIGFVFSAGQPLPRIRQIRRLQSLRWGRSSFSTAGDALSGGRQDCHHQHPAHRAGISHWQSRIGANQQT